MRVGRLCGNSGSGEIDRMGDIGASMSIPSNGGSNYVQVGRHLVDCMVLKLFTLTGSSLGSFEEALTRHLRHQLFLSLRSLVWKGYLIQLPSVSEEDTSSCG